MDEPTAVLTPQEVDELFKIMRFLVDQGKSIIFITHKLREVMECSDRITVIRGGKVVGTTKPPLEHRARRDGFPVQGVSEAARQADILFLLIPDEVMPLIYHEQIEPGLAEGNVLNFASGYNVTFRLIVPPPSVDVVIQGKTSMSSVRSPPQLRGSASYSAL